MAAVAWRWKSCAARELAAAAKGVTRKRMRVRRALFGCMVIGCSCVALEAFGKRGLTENT